GCFSDLLRQPIVACRAGCGAIYCSDGCRRKCWESGHSVLCLGLVSEERHPLVQHKVGTVAAADTIAFFHR
ncbi:unnamed protein product, partial [Scytosiphon promiscuus]